MTRTAPRFLLLSLLTLGLAACGTQRAPQASAPQAAAPALGEGAEQTGDTVAAVPSPLGSQSVPGSAFAQRVFELTNAARAQARTCGGVAYAAAPALTYNAALERAAQGHAADMAARNYFSHTSQDGRTFAQRITNAGYVWRTVAENIAAGHATPEAVVAGWLGSAGHCRNLMNPSFREIGVGYAYNAGSTYRHYWVQNFGAAR